MDGNGKGGTILEAFKSILQSQVGGWVLACLAFGFMSWWTIQDRATIYADMAKLREHGLELIMETRDAVALARGGAAENKVLILEAKKVTDENNDLLKEIRSFMNLPLENRSDIKEIIRRLKKQPEEDAP